MGSIIQVKNISKKYNINQQRGGYVALRDVLANIIKKPFYYAKHKAMEITGKAGREEFWALKDINFTVEKGAALGIIGANGAGKSTLLKILTQITPPTTGEIRMEGKVASLLEVGTGFHPELSGRENIFLNGAILGMRKEEIEKKFDEIVEFSGIGKFLDTPVKRYSSGMYVRLAFSVAAHLEPDILLVDEVLSVGDADFQKKCLGKMDDVTKKSGRTILFVSHNMTAVQKLCKRCILLKDGKIEMMGATDEVVKKYLNTARMKTNLFISHQKIKNSTLKTVNATINGQGNDSLQLNSNEKEIKIELLLNAEADCKLSMYATLRDRNMQAIGFYSPGHINNCIFTLSKGEHKITGTIILPHLSRGQYSLDVGLANPGITVYIEFPLSIHFYFSGYPTKTGIIFEQNDITGYQILDGDLKLDN